MHGSGPVDLLFTPGLVSHLDLDWEDTAYRAFVRQLARFCRVIRFDKRGTGLSDPAGRPPTMAERYADAVAVLAAADAGPVVPFGYCEGGPIGLQLAAGQPELVRGLVLCGTTAHAAPPAVVELLRRTVAVWGSGATIELFAPSRARDAAQRTAQGQLERAAASPAMARATFEALGIADVTELLPSVRVPALVVHRRDEMVPVAEARGLAERLPDARYTEVDGCDHLPWVGDAEPIVAAIASFLASLELAPRPAAPHAAPARPKRPISGVAALTPRERQVADLVADGLSNPEIARRLFLSRHTVESHLKSITAKLGVDGRARIATMLRPAKDPRSRGSDAEGPR